MTTYQRDQSWVLWFVVAFVAACSIGVAAWSISQWSPEHQAEAARIEEQTRLDTAEREAWIENELPKVHATWAKVFQGVLIAGGVVVAVYGLYRVANWAMDVAARRKAYQQLPAWQVLPRNRPILLPEGAVYHTGHGATDIWLEPGQADVERLLVAGEADAIRARAIFEALSGVRTLNHPQRRALGWAEYKLIENGDSIVRNRGDNA